MNNTKLTLLLIVQLAAAEKCFTQVFRDTLYYDYKWAICEKPIASFYRIAEIHTTSNNAFFTGRVRDFYGNGQMEMEGNYDSLGKKDGRFVFYNKMGKQAAVGEFKKDVPMGIWSYFDKDERLNVQLKFDGALDFTPFFVVSSAGDTMLRNGNGKFNIATTDFPYVFHNGDTVRLSSGTSYTIQGSSREGKKEGRWITSTSSNPSFADELYKQGSFVKGRWVYANRTTAPLSKPVKLVMANTFYNKFLATEQFSKDHVFNSYGSDHSGEAVARFLFDKQLPFIVSRSTSFEHNIADFMRQVIASIDMDKINQGKNIWQGSINAVADHFNGEAAVLLYSVQSDQKERWEISRVIPITSMPKINVEVTYTLEPEGQLSNITTKGNLDKDDLARLTYYLSCLSNLKPKVENGKPIAVAGKMYLFTKRSEVVQNRRKFIIYRLICSTKTEEETQDNFAAESFHLSQMQNGELVITLDPIL